MFEAGKRYKFKSPYGENNTVYECIAVTGVNAFMKIVGDKNGSVKDGLEFLQNLTHSNTKYYYEYKEPVIHKRYVPVYKGIKGGTLMFGGVFDQAQKEYHCKFYKGPRENRIWDLIDWIEITYEENS